MTHIRYRSRLFSFSIVVSILMISGCTEKEFIETGHQEIDHIRREIKDTPTNQENFRERVHGLALWKRLLMFSGADLNLDSVNHKGHFNFPGNKVNEFSQELANEIEYQYEALEEVYSDFIDNKESYIIRMDRKPEDNNGRIHDWPYLRGNPEQTAFTDSPGPMKGELLWKFPSPHAWYARPAFDNGKVFMGSPGISYESYCIDTETGDYIWKTIPRELRLIQMGSYGPRASSSVVNTDEHIIFRRIQVNGYREHILYVNKETGEHEKGIINNEFLNSSSGYAPLVGNDEYLIYPQGIQPEVQQPQKLYVDQEEYRKNREDYPFDSIVCKSTKTGELVWRDYIGEFYSEPMLDGDRIYCGNMEGSFRCYETSSGTLLWENQVGSPINAMPAADSDAVYIGDRSGMVYCFDKVSGKKIWSSKLNQNPRAFQNFSRFYIHEDKAYVGSSDKNLYCFDANSGDLDWNILLDDWVRAASIAIQDHLYVATMSGRLYCINSEDDSPEVIWDKIISEFPVFADLTQYNGDIYVSTSDFYLVNVNPLNGDINWKTSIFERVPDESGEPILADIVGQPDNQSSVMVVDGVGFFGTQRFVYALDIKSGKEVWKYEVRGQVCGAPVVDNGKVFFGQRGGTPYFYCLNAENGNLVWKKRIGHVWASAHFFDGLLYLNTEGGVFLCLNEEDGKLVWQFDTGLKGLSYNTPAVYQNLVYFGNNHEYYAFDRLSGKLIWTFNIGEGKTDSGTCMAKDSIFYCGGLWGDRFYAVNALEGKLIWEYFGSCNTPPATDGQYVVFNTHLKRNNLLVPDETVCLDAKSGEFQYKHLFGGLSGPAIGNNLLFASSTGGAYFKAWELATGKIRWSYLLGGRPEESCVTIYGDKAFIIASDGYVYAFH